MANAREETTAAARPATARSATRTANVGATAANTLATVNTASAIKITRRRGYGFNSTAIAGALSANTRANTATSWPAVPVEMRRSVDSSKSSPAITNSSVPSAREAMNSPMSQPGEWGRVMPASYSMFDEHRIRCSRNDGILGLWRRTRSEEHTSELQSREKLVCRLLLEKKK